MKINIYFTTSLHPCLRSELEISSYAAFCIYRVFWSFWIELSLNCLVYWDPSDYICVFKLHIFGDEYEYCINQNENISLVSIYLK